MSDLTPGQRRYLESVDGRAHQSAMEIIGELERELQRRCDDVSLPAVAVNVSDLQHGPALIHQVVKRAK